MTTNPTTVARSPAARSLDEILAAVRMATCGQCWQESDAPCVHGPDGAVGYHVARVGRAMRRGLISGPEMIAVLQTLGPFTGATLVYGQPADGAR